MKAAQLREQSVAELEKTLSDLEEQLFKLRFQKSTGQLENPVKMREVRKDIARVLTVLNELRTEEKAG
jgi:large subunit ribosomal protein L29